MSVWRWHEWTIHKNPDRFHQKKKKKKKKKKNKQKQKKKKKKKKKKRNSSMNSVKWPDKKLIHRILWQFYKLTMNYQRDKLRKNSIYHFIKRNKIPRDEFH